MRIVLHRHIAKFSTFWPMDINRADVVGANYEVALDGLHDEQHPIDQQ